MSEFVSWRDYQDFAAAVRSQQRYIRTPQMEAFLQVVLRTAENRVRAVPDNWPFYRAQLGNTFGTIDADGMAIEEAWAYPPERMKPLPSQGREGRVNAKGILCLYGATSRETAMAEVRPWLGAHVSVGLFKTLRELKVVDCSKFHAKSRFYSPLLEWPIGHHPSPKEVEDAVWTYIDQAFSEPVTDSDDLPDYVPTQILAELFKTSGYDGLAYKSRLTTDGFNVVFFDVRVARQIHGWLYSVSSVQYGFSDTPDDEYFIDESGGTLRQRVTSVRGLQENREPDH